MFVALARAVAGVVLVAGLAGCGGASTSGTAVDEPPAVGSGPAAVPESAPAALSQVAGGRIPAELVGNWLHATEGSSLFIRFDPSGRFRMGQYEGTATVRGATMVMQIDGQAPTTNSWSLRGGVLELGGRTFVRDDRDAGVLSIVGYWIKTDGFASLRFAADGSFELVDEANTVTTGAYELRGNQLVLSSRTRPPAAYLIALGDGLTVADVNGVPIAHYTRAG